MKPTRTWAMVLAGLVVVAMTGAAGCSDSKNEGMTIENSYTQEQAIDDAGIAAQRLDDSEPETEPGELDGSLTGEITYWTWDQAAPYYAERFTKKYPGAKVTINVIPTQDNQYQSKITQVLATGAEVPDVIMVENDFYGREANNIALEDLGGVPYNAMDMRGDYFDFWFDSGIGEDGVLRIMPNSPGMAGNFYRRDIAGEYLGTGNPEEVGALLTDWEAVYELGIKVKEQSGGTKFIIADAVEVYQYMLLQTGKALVEDGVINTEIFIEPLKMARRFREAGIDAKQKEWTPEWTAGMQNGDVLMYLSGSWGESYVVIANVKDTQDGLWGVTNMPFGNVNRGGNGFAIPKDAGNKELAWAFVKFAVTDMTMQADQLKLFACFPALREAADDPYFQLPVPLFDGQTARQKYAELGEDMIFVPRTGYDQAISTIMEKYRENVINGQMEPEEAVEQMKTEMLSQHKELS